MADDRLTEIAARAAAVASPPWTLTDDLDGDGYPGHLWVVRTPESGDEEPDEQAIVVSIGNHAIGEFIAHAREDVPWLLAEVERLRTVIAALAEGTETLHARVAELDEDSSMLNALHAAGVDNWEGYGVACEGR